MAYEIPGFSFTLPSNADMRTGVGQFRFVDVNSSGKAIVPTGAGAAVIGVRQNKPNADEAMTIVGSGITFLEAGAAITAGDAVTTDASGRAITAATGNQVHGRALQTASGAGVEIAVLLDKRPAVV